MHPLIISNWKMNMSLNSAIDFCETIENAKLANIHDLIICPPAPYLALLSSKFPSLTFAAQNISSIAPYGAYTGEHNAAILKSCKVHYSLIGHSERRTLFGETDEIVAQKLRCSLEGEITPIICIGEPLEAKNTNQYSNFLQNQLDVILDIIAKHATSTQPSISDLIIAYEPIWAIGSGIIPTQNHLKESFDIIKSYIAKIDEIYEKSRVAKNIKLVYGGSVSLDNIKQILDAGADGCLIGKASLDCKNLIEILTVSY